MKLSIIVPIYNVEKYIKRCIDSILSQTLKDFELILVDDGSPDNSGKICDEYALKDERIKVIHKANGGVSSARNAGLDVAKGEYIGFIDPDDYISQDMYELLLNEAETGNYDVVQCKFLRLFENGSVEYRMENIDYKEFIGTDEILNGFFRNEIIQSVWSKLFKREIIGDTKFSDELRIAEDKLFTHNCLANAKRVKTINKHCYFYLVSDTSVIHSKITEKIFDDIKVLDIFKELYKDNEVLKHAFSVHYAEVVLDLTFKVLSTDDFVDRLPELRRRIIDLKGIIFRNSFSKKQKLFTFLLLIAPQFAYKITSKYLKKGKNAF